MDRSKYQLCRCKFVSMVYYPFTKGTHGRGNFPAHFSGGTIIPCSAFASVSVLALPLHYVDYGSIELVKVFRLNFYCATFEKIWVNLSKITYFI